MPLFSMPVVFKIKAESLEEAQEIVDGWVEDLDMDHDVPDGTEDIDSAPEYEVDDDGNKIISISGTDEDEESSFSLDGDDFAGEVDDIPV